MHEAAPAAHISIHAFQNTFMIQVVAAALKSGEKQGHQGHQKCKNDTRLILLIYF